VVRALAVLLTAFAIPNRAAAFPSWSVIVHGRDRTAAADPLEAAGEVLVDLAALAPALGLDVTLAPATVAVVDHRGTRWTGRPGASLLRAGEDTLELGWVRQTRTTWHVPAAAAASLAGLDLTLDRAAAVVELVGPRPSPAAAGVSAAAAAGSVESVVRASARPSSAPPAAASHPGPDGSWQSFTLPKSEAEMTESARLEAAQDRPATRREVAVLPAAHQSLRATVGLGFREGGEWGAELGAFGLWSDWNVELAAAAAFGPAGSDVQGHLFLEAPGRLWSFEAGSLYSQAWGYAEGLRVARESGRHRPTLSLYLPGTLTRYRDPVVAYRDDVLLGRGLSVSGEATSAGRWSLTSRLRRGAFLGSVYAQAGGDMTASGGASIFLDLGAVGLSGSYQSSDGEGRRVDSHSFRLSLPTVGRLTSALETWDARSDLSRSQAHGATFSMPMGDVRVRLRYLFRTNELRPPDREVLSQEHHELVALVGYARSSRVRLDLQLASRWQPGGEAAHRADLQASFDLTDATHLQLFGGFSSLDAAPERYLVRLTQDLPRGLRLIAEVGDVIGFPVGRDLLEPGQEPGSVKLLIQRTWDVDTPAGGSTVAGRVLGPDGAAAADVPVRLGPYRVFTDAGGRFLFRRVPAGGYELSLEEAGLPAHLQAVSGPMEVQVTHGRREDHALYVAPLGRVGGRVFVDRDGDREAGDEEGVGGVVVLLGDEATTTTRDGSFAFHNLAAGRYTLEVVAAMLPGDLQVTPPSRFEIGLPAGESLDQLDVRLEARLRPVVYQEM